MLRDFRFAWRALRRSPWYALTVVGVLTAGISLTTVTFAVVDGVLFKPLPYPNADELYLIRADTTGDPQDTPPPVSWAEITAWRAAVPDVTIGVASASSSREEQVAMRDYYSASVDEHFLDVLGVRPMVGGFAAEDHEARTSGTRERVTLISRTHWRRAYGADTGVIGRSVLTIARGDFRVTHRIAGILPATFVFPTIAGQEQPDILSPLGPPRDVSSRDSADVRVLRAIVRVLDPRDLPRLRERLLDATLALARQAPPSPLHGRALQIAPPFDRITLVPLADWLGRGARPAFLLASAAAGLLLLLACLSVAGLAAARALSRQRDLAVHRALGAGAWNLTRGQLAELCLLIVPACAFALVASGPLLAATVDLLPASLPLLKTPAIDIRVFAASAIAGVLSLAAIVLWPARMARRAALLSALGRATPGASARTRSGGWFVAAQTAAGFVLVTAAGLTGASLMAVWSEDTGYARSRLALLETYASFYTTNAQATEQLHDTWRLLRLVPGVGDVAVAGIDPIFQSVQQRAWADWIPQAGAGDVTNVDSRMVSSNYFRVMGLEPVDGSWPEAAIWDDDGAVAIVSESAARFWWPDRRAVGQILVSSNERLRATTTPKVVVGVVRDARYSALDREPIRDLYVPNPIREGTYGAIFVVRTDRAVDDVMPGLLQALSIHRLRVAQALSFNDALFKSVRHRALPAWLFGLLGGSGLVILGAGTLGMLAMSVSQRTREMGIRLALGSTSAGIVRLIVGEQVRPVLLGLAAGAGLAMWTVGYLDSQLYGVSAWNPGVWTIVAATVLATALTGSLIPSVRSAMTDPVAALRGE